MVLLAEICVRLHRTGFYVRKYLDATHQAKDLVDGAPKEVKTGVDKAEAEALKNN